MEQEGIAVWRQIEQTILGEIEAKRLPPGARLPSEHELAERFGVNRHTARHALQALCERGVIRTEKGRGSFVESPMVDYRIAPRTRFSENIASHSRTPSGELVRSQELKADAMIADALGLAPGAPLILLETVGIADGQRISLGAHYFAKARFGKILSYYKRLGSITKSLAKMGVSDYFRKTTRISVRMPDKREARLLRQKPTEPVLIVESINVDPQGQPIEYGVACMSGARTQLVIDF